MSDIVKISNDKFLTENICKQSYRVEIKSGVDFIQLADAFKQSEFNEICKDEIFAYVKVEVSDIDCCRFLSSVGFYLVDTNFTLDKKRDSSKTLNGDCVVRSAKSEDRYVVREIAENNFIYTRFHLDPYVDNKYANQLKGLWAENYFNGKRGDAMFVAEVGGKVAGFLQLLKRESNLVIDLIAVDSSFQKMGIAQDIMAVAEKEFDDCEKIIVGTQLANIPSIRCYEKAGFSYCSSSYVFHYCNSK